MATQEELELQQKITNQLAKQVEFEKTRARLAGETLTSLEEEQALLARREQVIRQSNVLIDETNENTFNRQKEFIEKELQAELRKGEIIENIEKARKTSNKAELEAIKKQIKAQEELVKTQEKSIKAMKASAKVAEDLVDTMGNLVGISKDTGSTFKDIFEAFKGGRKGISQFAQTFSKAFAGRFGLTNVLGMFANNQFQVAVNFNKIQSEVLSATGASYELTQTIEDAARAYSQFGVTQAEAARAATGLYTNFARFSSLNNETEQQIIGTTVQLQNLGVAAETTADNFNFLVSGIGMSVPQATEALTGLTERTAALGIAPQEVNQAFTALAPRLAEFGARAPQIFERTAKLAKSLGINIQDMGNTIFGLSDQVSTFGGAADVISTLNVAFGDIGLSAFDLTMALAEGGPEAQLELIRKSVMATGKSFQSLGIFGQRFVAKGLNQDVATLNQLFSESASTQNVFGKEQKSLSDLSKQTTDLTEAQRIVFENLTKAVNKSAEAMQNFANSATELTAGGGGFDIVSGVTGIASAFQIIGALKGFKGFLKGRGAAGAAETVGDVLGGAAKKTGRGSFPKPPSPRQRAMARARNRKTPGLGDPTRLSKVGTKGVGKTAGKFGLKALGKIPGVSLLTGLALAGGALAAGDVVGALGELASGAAATVPGLGTGASLAIDASLAARDMGAFDSSMPSTSPSAASPITTAPIMPQTSRGVTAPEVEQAMKNALASAGGTEQPIKVELYLDRSGTNKIAETTVKYIDRNYSMTGNARVPV
jgi:ABC-type transporter Mla subunit MlaD